MYVTYVSYPIPWKSIFFLEAMDSEDDLMRDCVTWIMNQEEFWEDSVYHIYIYNNLAREPE